MTALLQVKQLCKAFGGNQAVNHVSFDVAAGELLALIGPNVLARAPPFTSSTDNSNPMPAQCCSMALTS